MPLGEIDEEKFSVAYQGGESLVYKVSWTGGLKIGELHMEMNRVDDESGERYELRARVKDSGLFHFFYPVDDTFITIVEGEQRLPVSYYVRQKEGRSYEATRETHYDQQTGAIRYRKNEQDWQLYKVDGVTHNEFSSFFFTRVLQLDPERPVIVPTFADGKRHEVVVRTGVPKRISDTVRGDVNVIPVTPVMEFKGLYDKDGDTVIWFTDDLCRIPVRINSKILIGSLTAELVSYSNPLCVDQSHRHREIPEPVLRERELGQGD
ncbi:MAG: DUF3108 domain-containing protein [Proteobacteria bacterium]|nr:DUF3108 domain-containing protein [Pseudomonadota bacterium]MBU1138950.1 DUF3108 domain-containing protein [Pseudomonadota bacterium]MBU1231913.1 DUF3108 domain-containing protein [Pseudomonadota bacterium]MBU1419535.1 DUF3108 domain-containing protein [Pseudomonadota bacterium]MBU1456601.1 DUF3108 domain-containing protein [Pseudomonadota bacterium]